MNHAMVSWLEVKLTWDLGQDVIALRRKLIEGYYGDKASRWAGAAL